MEEVSMVAFSGCIWLQAFLVALEMRSFSNLKVAAIVGNLLAFYGVNFAVSMVKSGGMYTITFWICGQPAYWFSVMLISVLGMGPILALKYFWFFYRPNAINVLQQLEHLQSSRAGSVAIESPWGVLRKDEGYRVRTQRQAELGAVHEPWLYNSSAASLERASLSCSPDQSPSSPLRARLSAYTRSKSKCLSRNGAPVGNSLSSRHIQTSE